MDNGTYTGIRDGAVDVGDLLLLSLAIRARVLSNRRRPTIPHVAATHDQPRCGWTRVRASRAKTGWSEVGKPLPPGLWAEVDRPVKRAVFWCVCECCCLAWPACCFASPSPFEPRAPHASTRSTYNHSPRNSLASARIQMFPVFAYGAAVFFLVSPRLLSPSSTPHQRCRTSRSAAVASTHSRDSNPTT